MSPGDAVGMVVVTASTSGLPVASAVAPDLGSAVVWGVENSTAAQSPTDRVWVSLVVDEGLRVQVSQAAADGTLRLVLLGGS